MRLHKILCALLFAYCIPKGFAQGAATFESIPPPMGWNSWDSYGLTVTEAQFEANADWLALNLKQYGWQYVIIDEGWYLPNPESAKPDWLYTISNRGLYIPAANRFPSSANGAGFKPIAKHVHELGLKFGIHIIRGIPRRAVATDLPISNSDFHAAEAADESDICTWNPDNFGVKASQAGQAYYDSMMKLYASWDIDFVKVDCISSPYKGDEIRMLNKAIARSGRPILLSLSPGPAPVDKAQQLRQYAQMWRISGDLWDLWMHDPGVEGPQGLLQQFDLLAAWAKYAGPGHWPDADMLPIGHLGPHPSLKPERDSRFTPDEARTLLTLWAIARAPLMLGSNLTSMDPAAKALVTNAEVIAVNQQSHENHPVLKTSTTVAWTARSENTKAEYLAVFNVSDLPITVRAAWKDLGLSAKRYRRRDLWIHESLPEAASLLLELKPHASALYSLTAD